MQVAKFFLLFVISFGLNIPLGMWRIKTKKFSLQWFAAIHLTVPLIYYLRHGMAFPSWSAPFLIGAAVGGQILGGIWRNMLETKKRPIQIDSAAKNV